MRKKEERYIFLKDISGYNLCELVEILALLCCEFFFRRTKGILRAIKIFRCIKDFLLGVKNSKLD